ncbi:3678_t:CDS:2 [Racocetra fulgida]|uniref:3678_t:CDS:1 n=1 Tax=Racocetra fulgida TaxID=60492 RepID=A0A9N9F8A3_9GLOM|nr:3678_t:CDS:2 [Racocetra fulgida]
MDLLQSNEEQNQVSFENELVKTESSPVNLSYEFEEQNWDSFENELVEKESSPVNLTYESEEQNWVSFKNELVEKESSPVNLSYESDVIKIFDDSSDEENKPMPAIYSRQTFQMWDDAEAFLKQYGLGQGFSIRKRRTELCLEDGIQVLCKVTINNCNRTRLVAAALLEDETEDSFTWALTNSTQRVEGFNKKIHNSIRANSSLITLVKEIQDVLDREVEYARVEEYKHQILTVRLATIPKVFFKSLDPIVNEYLIEPVSINVRKQMHECFFYDAYKLDITDWSSIERVTKSSIKIQESYTRKRQRTDTNIQSSNITLQSGEPIQDNRKRCQKCGQKGHNRAICKSENES